MIPRPPINSTKCPYPVGVGSRKKFDRRRALALAAQGLTTRVIAERLGISRTTCKRAIEGGEGGES